MLTDVMTLIRFFTMVDAVLLQIKAIATRRIHVVTVRCYCIV